MKCKFPEWQIINPSTLLCSTSASLLYSFLLSTVPLPEIMFLRNSSAKFVNGIPLDDMRIYWTCRKFPYTLTTSPWTWNSIAVAHSAHQFVPGCGSCNKSFTSYTFPEYVALQSQYPQHSNDKIKSVWLVLAPEVKESKSRSACLN